MYTDSFHVIYIVLCCTVLFMVLYLVVLQCGVAGVITHENKLLVVKETTKAAGWKFPGGYTELGNLFLVYMID